MRKKNWILLIPFFISPAHTRIAFFEFHKINHLIHSRYAPLVKVELNSEVELREIFDGFGGPFRVDHVAKVLNEDRFIITMTGEIARSEKMTDAGYAIAACHEWGHILGGQPKASMPLKLWSSVEGQADYWATSVCMWDIIGDLKEEEGAVYDEKMIALCQGMAGADSGKVNACTKIMAAISAMADYFNRSGLAKDMDMAANDTKVVDKTLQGYPSRQCRLDTWRAGALKAPRPPCWYTLKTKI